MTDPRTAALEARIAAPEPVGERCPCWQHRDGDYCCLGHDVVAAGSQRAVARAHGWHQSKVKHRVESYMAAAGIEGPPPGIISPEHSHRATLSHSGQGDRTAWRKDQARLREAQEALERALVENRRLRARVADLEEQVARWDRLEAKLDALIARPTGAPAVVSHRRKSDGGAGGREEMRQLRRTA